MTLGSPPPPRPDREVAAAAISSPCWTRMRLPRGSTAPRALDSLRALPPGPLAPLKARRPTTVARLFAADARRIEPVTQNTDVGRRADHATEGLGVRGLEMRGLEEPSIRVAAAFVSKKATRS